MLYWQCKILFKIREIPLNPLQKLSMTIVKCSQLRFVSLRKHIFTTSSLPESFFSFLKQAQLDIKYSSTVVHLRTATE